MGGSIAGDARARPADEDRVVPARPPEAAIGFLLRPRPPAHRLDAFER